MAYTGLAKTTFAGGPDDALGAVDAYVKGTKSTVNSIQNNVNSLIPGLNSLGINVKTFDLNVASVENPSQVVDRLTTGPVDVKNCFRGFSDIGKKLFKIPGDLAGAISATINGVSTKLKGIADSNVLEKIKNFKGFGQFKGFGDFNSTICVTNVLTGGKYIANIVDKGAVSSLITGVTLQGNKYGVNNIFSNISNVITDKDILLSAAKNIIPAAAQDLRLLKDLAETTIQRDIKNILPNIAGSAIKNFRIEKGTKANELPSIYQDNKLTLDYVDPSWNVCKRDESISLSGILLTDPTASDFYTTMSSSVKADVKTIPTPIPGTNIEMPVYDTPEMFLMSTKDIGVQSVTSCLASDFPTIPVTTNDSTDYVTSNFYNSNLVLNTTIDPFFKVDQNATEIVALDNIQPISSFPVGTIIGTSKVFDTDTKVVTTRIQGTGNMIHIKETNYDLITDAVISEKISDLVIAIA